MAVDLGDLIEPLQREVSPPGEDLFPNATEDEWLGNLQDAFWDARLDGLLEGYTEVDGSVTPVSGTTEMARELQQIVVLYAGVRIVRNHLRALNTLFRAKAGPVEFEQQKSANLLTDLLAELRDRRKTLLIRLGDLGLTDSYYIDALVARDQSLGWGDTFWWG